MFMMKKNLKIRRSKNILFRKIHQVSTLWATSWQIHPQWNFSKLDLFWFNFKLAILGESKDWKAESILKALLGFSTVPLASKQGAEHSLPSICTRLPKLWNMQQWDWNCFHLLASLPCRCVGLYDQGFVGLWSRCDGSGPTLPCFPCKGCRSRPTCCLVTVAFHIQLLNMSHKTNQRLSENIKVWCVERAGKLWDYSNFWILLSSCYLDRFRRFTFTILLFWGVSVSAIPTKWSTTTNIELHSLIEANNMSLFSRNF